MGIRQWFSKLLGRGEEGEASAESSLRAGESSERPRDEVEVYLASLGDERTAVDRDRIAHALERLRRDGRERRAIEYLADALRARPGEVEIRAALAFAFVARLEYEAARPLLEQLAATDEYGVEAELVLGDAAEREGDLQEALRHYERVLARDVSHGRALARAARLRERLGSAAPVESHATMVQPGGAATEGRYRLLRELGRGGAAAVYIAQDQRLDRKVALKVYHPKVMSEDGPGQLAREAALPARVGHPDLIKVLDVDAELGAVIMELLPGGSLKDRLKRRELTVDESLAVIEALCQPVGALHARGIVHRDLKPGNVLLRGERLDDLVLTDLGVALLPGERHRPGVGTLAYMAPEQRDGEVVDARADVFSLGVMLAEMLGDRAPRSGPVADLITRCLSEDPGGRPRDANDLGRLVGAVRFAARRRREYEEDLSRLSALVDGATQDEGGGR